MNPLQFEKVATSQISSAAFSHAIWHYHEHGVIFSCITDSHKDNQDQNQLSSESDPVERVYALLCHCSEWFPLNQAWERAPCETLDLERGQEDAIAVPFVSCDCNVAMSTQMMDPLCTSQKTEIHYTILDASKNSLSVHLHGHTPSIPKKGKCKSWADFFV